MSNKPFPSSGFQYVDHRGRRYTMGVDFASGAKNDQGIRPILTSMYLGHEVFHYVDRILIRECGEAPCPTCKTPAPKFRPRFKGFLLRAYAAGRRDKPLLKKLTRRLITFLYGQAKKGPRHDHRL